MTDKKHLSYKAPEMGGSVKCLQHKREDLSSDLSAPTKKPDVVMHICNPSDRKREIGKALGSLTGQSSLISDPQNQQEALSQQYLLLL